MLMQQPVRAVLAEISVLRTWISSLAASCARPIMNPCDELAARSSIASLGPWAGVSSAGCRQGSSMMASAHASAKQLYHVHALRDWVQLPGRCLGAGHHAAASQDHKAPAGGHTSVKHANQYAQRPRAAA